MTPLSAMLLAGAYAGFGFCAGFGSVQEGLGRIDLHHIPSILPTFVVP